MSWVCVGHPEPDRHVAILLNGEIDVSRNHAMVSLVPFLVAIRLDGIDPGKRPWLSIGDVGRVDLRLAREVDGIGLFETTGCVNRCLPAPLLHLHYLEQRWKLFRDRNPRNIKMAPRDLFCKFVLFTMPRPVVLVGHERNGRSNLFPMDLVGEAGYPCFLLGLHRTSPAIPSMIEAGRLSVSAVPLEWKKTVFALGRNHREATFEDLSPVPEGALTVRKVRVERTVEVGSHVLFITTTESLERRAEGLQMCHTHAFYQRYLKKSGRGLPEAPHPLALTGLRPAFPSPPPGEGEKTREGAPLSRPGGRGWERGRG